MASPSENGVSFDEQPHPILRCDRAIDIEYIRDKHNPHKYAAEPWNHYKDPLKSYLSVRFDHQDDFHKKIKDEKAQARIAHEQQRIQQTRSNFLSHSSKQKLMVELRHVQQQWREKVFKELDQIRVERRKAVQQNVKKDNRDKLHQWDCEHLARLDRRRKAEGAGSSYNKARRPSMMSRMSGLSQVQRAPPPPLPPPPAAERPAPPVADTQERDIEPYYGFKAGAMYFKKMPGGLVGYSSDNIKYQGSKFPNQKILMKDILDHSNDNPLSHPCPENTVRYFHFPTNNMEWIEKAIDRYYAEKGRVSIDGRRILAREYWKGQMHGSGPTDRMTSIQGGTPILDARRGGPVHARHMRSKCSLIPRETVPKHARSRSAPLLELGLAESTPKESAPRRLKKTASMAMPLPEKNVALFLPYLHWETSSRRAKMVKVISDAVGNDCDPKKKKPSLYQAVNNARNLTRKQTKLLEDSKDKEGFLSRRQLLGKYLLTLARIADEMDYEADERLLRENVVNNPPLHIRRTLDQYYFLTLDNTSERDRDQVVYRGTVSRSLSTRVVMVDQLWLWILDDNTIITSFPRRWGRNKPDPSGVHKSLRERLAPGTEVIKSIHHLAMIIVDQCSRVFFDRTKPLDQRPEVMDLFAAAIGHVTEHTRIAYDHFWEHTKLDSQNLIPTRNEAVRHKYLDINPEGVILKEAQDIAEELMIMKRVYAEQLKVIKDFMRHLTHPHGKHAAVTGEAILINKFIAELRKLTPSNAEEEEEEPPDLEAQFNEESVHEAHTLVELIQARQAEIMDLEEAALRACNQLEGLLALKQQQASIVEARAALQRADESVSQGRTIQAFTIVTIIFLPLGFFATFFGMNNWEINQAEWMSLWEQIKWMFGGSAIVIFISVSLAFSAWFRAIIRLMFEVPWALLFEWTNIHEWWKGSMWNHANLERKSTHLLEEVSRNRRKRQEEKRKKKAKQSDSDDEIRSTPPGNQVFETGGTDSDEKVVQVHNRARGSDYRADMV